MRIIENLDLTTYNAYRLNATCARAFFPSTEDDLISIYQKESNINKIILGNGNNVILSKKYYKEDFIIFNGNFNKINVTRNILKAESGATLEQLSLLAMQHSLSGLEIFYDIPSSVGGAVVMNAGASGEEIKNVLVKARYLDLADMQIKEIQAQEIGFEYRNSFFQKNTDKIVMLAWFKAIYANDKAIRLKMEEVKKKRWAKQPRDYPNCGSVFKRPKDYYVGQLIDELNLKGLTVGGAQISKKHGGFIINTGEASGMDIINLIKTVQEKISHFHGINLEIEQRII